MNMATWQGKADASKASSGTGGGNKFPAAPRGFYTIQVADYTDGITQETKRPKVNLMCEIAEGEHMGKRVYVTITQIPSGEKGEGIMIHQLHAFGMALDGNYSFNTEDLQGRTASALLGVEMREKIVNGRTYYNEVNVVEALYTEKHPQPKELPPAPEPKTKPQPRKPEVSAAAQGVFGKKEDEEDSIPF